MFTSGSRKIYLESGEYYYDAWIIAGDKDENSFLSFLLVANYVSLSFILSYFLILPYYLERWTRVLQALNYCLGIPYIESQSINNHHSLSSPCHSHSIYWWWQTSSLSGGWGWRHEQRLWRRRQWKNWGENIWEIQIC